MSRTDALGPVDWASWKPSVIHRLVAQGVEGPTRSGYSARTDTWEPSAHLASVAPESLLQNQFGFAEPAEELFGG